MLFLVASVGLLQRSGRLRMMSGGAGGFVRLDKLLADRGAGSRKDVDRLIRKGLVELENPETGSYEVVGKSGGKLKVPWDACPLVDGFDYPPPPLLAAYHKPLGVVSSMKDDKGRPDLASVLPQPWQKALHPVGRLDADTTGLLLFCRDGDLTHRLLHPKYVVEREYVATVEGAVDEELLRGRLAAGVETVEEGEPFVVQGELLSVEGQRVRCVFREGKYRMVRRVLANCGHPVVALHRERRAHASLSLSPRLSRRSVPDTPPVLRAGTVRCGSTSSRRARRRRWRTWRGSLRCGRCGARAANRRAARRGRRRGARVRPEGVGAGA